MPHYIGIAEQINEIKYFLVFFSLSRHHRRSDVRNEGVVQGGSRSREPACTRNRETAGLVLGAEAGYREVRLPGRGHRSGLAQSHGTKTRPAHGQGQALSFLSPGPAVSAGTTRMGLGLPDAGPVPSQVVPGGNATRQART